MRPASVGTRAPLFALPADGPLVGLLLAAVLLLQGLLPGPARAADAVLTGLIEEALRNNPELHAAESRVDSGKHRVPQAGALPDPSLSAGYTNEGLQKYTYGNSYDSVWTYGISQTVPFPGKLVQKSKVASKDVEVLQTQLWALRLQTVAKVKELYYELFLAYRTVALLEERIRLFEQVEKTALARYSAGMGDQRDAVMAQTEKYMLVERVEMARQRLQIAEGQFNAQLGRDVLTPVAVPAEPSRAPYKESLEALLAKASFDAPDTRTSQKRLEKAQTKVEAAKQEFFPDVTLSAGYSSKGYKAAQSPIATGDQASGPAGQSERWVDMWSGAVSVTIPLYFWTKQAEGLKESRADLSEARRDLESIKNMTAAAIRENFVMIKTSERIADLYTAGTIPKTRQDFELALAGYSGGKGDISGVIARLKTLLDSEVQYWTQVTDKQKAVARLEGLTGLGEGFTQAGAQAGAQAAQAGPDKNAADGGDAKAHTNASHKQ